MDDRRQLGEGGGIGINPEAVHRVLFCFLLFSLNVWEEHFKKENSNNKVKSVLCEQTDSGPMGPRIRPQQALMWWYPGRQWITGDSGSWGTVDSGGQWTLRDSGSWRTVDPGGQWE